MSAPRGIAILGATGSIGRSTLAVIALHRLPWWMCNPVPLAARGVLSIYLPRRCGPLGSAARPIPNSSASPRDD